MIQVINFKFKLPEDACIVNTTSRSDNWSSLLSPFYLGPIKLYGNYISQNVENGWQFSKCYQELGHLDENDNPTARYFEWAQKGWNDKWAHRYPAGRGIKPKFSYWDGEKLDYVSARKKIYIPAYTEAVKNTEAFKTLSKLYIEDGFNVQDKTLYLLDFDAHNLPTGYDYQSLFDNPSIKVGHAYVLAMMLEGKL